ncbi:MAG: adenosylcobinamide-GDP ribazoletransferase [Rhodobacteraceae bacterium]|nr:adenosylcobinamide-GDP ribazoletransferase [Paracoccaceae bacterium]
MPLALPPPADRPRLSDITHAAALLTRLPLRTDPAAGPDDWARAAWAWPLVGAGLGAAAAVLGWLVHGMGAPAGFTAALVLAFLALVTGALHEDGLADTADGLGARGDRHARLAAMRDSRIGAFGVLALVLVLLARFSAIAVLIGSGALFWALLPAGAVSRLPMVAAARLVPPARRDGLSAGLGVPPAASLALAAAIAAVAAALGFGAGGLWLLFWPSLAAALVVLIARLVLHGQTGDVLGAAQQVAEATALAVAVALLA